MTFSERLIYLRKERKISQKKIAEAIGMSEQAYQKYEYNKREPAYQKLIAIAEYFNVSIDYLVGRTENPEVNR